MNVGGLEVLVILVLGVGLTVLWLWALVDAATKPDTAYQAAGSNKVLWVIIICLLGALGALVYLFAIRSKLVAAQGS